MFLTKRNKMNWKKVIIAAVFVIFITIAGFFGLDTFIQPFFRGFDFSIWRWFGFLGDWKIWVAVSLFAFLVARALKLKKLKDVSLNVLLAVIFSEVITYILNICVGRMRPVIFDALGQTGFSAFSMSDIWHSFPSGHTAVAFAGLVSIGLMYLKVRPVTWTLAILTAISQICIGAYFPTDVLVAIFIGLIAADFIKSK